MAYGSPKHVVIFSCFSCFFLGKKKRATPICTMWKWRTHRLLGFSFVSAYYFCHFFRSFRIFFFLHVRTETVKDYYYSCVTPLSPVWFSLFFFQSNRSPYDKGGSLFSASLNILDYFIFKASARDVKADYPPRSSLIFFCNYFLCFLLLPLCYTCFTETVLWTFADLCFFSLCQSNRTPPQDTEGAFCLHLQSFWLRCPFLLGLPGPPQRCQGCVR